MQEQQHSYNSLRILSQTERGYIGQCSCCDHYNFAFGNLLFIFTEEGMRGFQSILYDSSYMQPLDETLPHGKNHLLPSPIPNFMLSFDSSELEEIKNLFQESFLTLEIDKIFSFNK